MNELRFNRRLALFGLFSFASAIFTGPIGIFGGMAIYSGMIGRLVLKPGAREQFEEDKKQEEKIRKISKGFRIPYSSLANYEEDEEKPKKNYGNLLKKGREAISKYFIQLSNEDYGNYEKINRISIKPKRNDLEVRATCQI